MDLLQQFTDYLLSQKNPPSKATVKNYKADVSQFIRWWESNNHNSFNPSSISSQTIEAYKQAKTQNQTEPNTEQSRLSARSIERHLSSLRKFFEFLKLEGIISYSPFEMENGKWKMENADPHRLRDFKNYLYVYNLSPLTIKNYVIDIKQFLSWAEEVSGVKDAWNVADKNVFSHISRDFIEEYKERLFSSANLSPVSINRKLSSIRKYMQWAVAEGLLTQNQESGIRNYETNSVISNAVRDPLQGTGDFSRVRLGRNDKGGDFSHSLEMTTLGQFSNVTIQQYSKFPPLRLLQKITKGISLVADEVFISPIAKLTGHAQYHVWKAKGRPLFTTASTELSKTLLRTKQNFSFVPRSILRSSAMPGNFPKAMYAPVSLKYVPFHKKVLHHLLYTRPKWYRRYQFSPMAMYFNMAILGIFIAAITVALYRGFLERPKQNSQVLAAVAPNRLLSFQGRLTDASDNPITATTNLRLAIYNSVTATGGALLWQEVDTVSPDSDGIFNVILGGGTSISQSIFGDNANLWLGVTVASTPELTPRQQLATVAYATNAEVLQGLPPITDAGVTTNTNAVLALNSSGAVAVAGSATTTFQASSGQLTVTGQTLVLQTNSSSAGNVVISPDGVGKINLHKPIVNTSNSNNITSAVGAVEVDDLFAILATSSGQSALTINQTSTGPLISASTSGTAKFTVDNDGNTTLAGDLAVNGATSADITSTTTTATLFDTTVTSLTLGSAATTLNLADAAITGTIDIGGVSNDGTTTVNIATNGTANADVIAIGNTNASTTLALTGGDDWNIAATGVLTLSASAAQTTAIVITDTDYTNALSVGDNNITGTAYSILATGGELTLDASTDIVLDADGADVILKDAGTEFARFTNSSTDLTVDIVGGQLYLADADVFNIGGLTGVAYNAISDSGTTGHSLASDDDLYIEGDLEVDGTIFADGNLYSPLSGTSGYWQRRNGALSPENILDDLLVGGTATNSSTTNFAKFGVLNINSGTPTASVSAGTAGGAYLTAAGKIATTALQPLTLGDTTTTGAIYLMPSGNVGIGTTVPLYKLDVTGTVHFTGAFTADSTTTFGTIAYTWPTLGQSDGFALTTNGAGTLSWADPATATSNYWRSANGTVYTANSTLDLLVGGTATNSSTTNFAKFAVLNVNSGTPTASVSAGTAGGAYLNATGTLATTALQPLTLGSSTTTGAVYLMPLGNVGVGTTLPLEKLDVSGNATASGNLTLYGAARSIQGTANQTLTLGGSSTGNIHLLPRNSAGFVGINTTNPVNVLSVNGAASFGTYASTAAPTNGLIVSGNVGIGTSTASSFNLEVAGNIGPEATGTRDLGSTTKVWNNIYANNLYATIPGTAGYWINNGGSLYPTNSTLDLLIGGTATNSSTTNFAKFAVLNVNSGTPTASVSAGVAGATFLTADGNLVTTARQTLTIGSSSTYNTAGNILLAPNGSGNVGIGTTNPVGNFSVHGTVNTQAGTIVNVQTSNDIFTASASGANKFVITNAGNVGIGIALPLELLHVAGNATASGNLTLSGAARTIQTTALNTLTLGGSTTGNIVIDSGSNILSLADATINLTGTNPVIAATATNSTIQLNANGTGTLTLNSGATGNIQFFSSSNTLSSAGVLTIASNLVLSNSGATTTFGGIAYTWPTSGQSDGFALTTNGSGTLSWQDQATSSTNYWRQANGTVYAANTTVDLLIGGTATNSATTNFAKFAVLNVNSGTPTASVSAGTAGGAYLTATGTLATTALQNLTLGANTTGSILFNPGAQIAAIDKNDITFNGKKNLVTTGMASVTDVYVYDTTKDFDGGKWTNDERAKASSWYNETIDATGANCTNDTNDRCGRKEFPEKAIIITTASDVFIFDGKDNTQWMNFDQTADYALDVDANNNPSSVFALNGKIYVGTNGSSATGMYVIDLINDRITRYNTTDARDFADTIDGRNADPGTPYPDQGKTRVAIINATVNDVHTTVVRGKLYTVVATDAGVSLINQTDNVTYDYSDNSGDDYNQVWLDRDGNLWTTNETTATLELWTLVILDSADQIAGTPDQTWDETTTPALTQTTPTIPTTPGALTVTEGTSTVDGKSPTIFVTTNLGLSVVQTKAGDQTNGSVKYYTAGTGSTGYITEEIVGDIRGMWPLDNSIASVSGTLIGNAEDASAKVKKLAEQGRPTFVSGVRGLGLSFNGSNQYLCTGAASVCSDDNDFDGLTAVSVGAWIKTNTSGSKMDIISKNLNFRLEVLGNNGDKAEFYVNRAPFTGITGTSDVIDNKWHFIVGTYDGTVLRIYVDGKQEAAASVTDPGNTPSDAIPVYIGTLDAGTGLHAFFNGTIDEPFITAEALTGGQVEHMYEVGKRALENHTASRIAGMSTADDYQMLQGTVNTAKAVAVDDSRQYAYVGTQGTDTGALTVLGIDSDTVVDNINSTTRSDDAGTANNLEDVIAVSVAGTPTTPYNGGATSNNNQGTIAIIGDDSGSTGDRAWVESANYSLYSTLASLTSPDLVKNNITANNIFQVFNTYNNYASTSGELYKSPVFSVDASGNINNKSLARLTIDSATTGLSTDYGSLELFNRNQTASNYNRLDFSTADNSGVDQIAASIGGIYTARAPGNVSGGLFFGTVNAGTWAERMRIAADGNVGIGTTSPGYKLDLIGGSERIDPAAAVDDGLVLAKSSDSDRNWITWTQGNTTRDWRIGMLGGDYDFVFMHAAGGASTASSPGSEFMRITDDGNVAIGTTSVGTNVKLETYANATHYIRMNGGTNVDSTTGLQFYNNNGNGMTTIDSYKGNLGISVGSPSTQRAAIYISNAEPPRTGVGPGYGTSSGPTALLEVTGIPAGYATMVVNNSGTVGDIFTASSSGTPRFVIRNDGNVGIGTTGPTARLQIGGSTGTGGIKLENGATIAGETATAGYMDFTSGQLRLFAQGTNATTRGAFTLQARESDQGNEISVIQTATNGDIYLAQSTGNVGIGTTTIPQKLTLAGGGASTNTYMQIDNYSATAGYPSGMNFSRSFSNTIGTLTNDPNDNQVITEISFRAPDSNNTAFRQAAFIDVYVDGAEGTTYVPGRFEFWTTNTSGTQVNALTIKNSGNVGIGTTGPETTLHLRNASGIAAITFRDETDGGASTQIGLERGSGTTDIFLGGSGKSTAIALVDIVNTRFGIGTTGPGAIIHAYNSSATAGDLEVGRFSAPNANAAGEQQYLTVGNTTNGGYLGYIEANASFGLGIHGSATALNVKGGNVGIGTTSPVQLLEMSGGNIGLGRINSSAYSRYVGLTGTSGTIVEGSSGGSQIKFETEADNDNLIHFLTHKNGVSHAIRMTIDPTGYVGIGTAASSGRMLTIKGDTADGTNYAIVTTDSSSNTTFYARNDGHVAAGWFSSGSPTYTAGVCWDNSGISEFADCNGAPGDMAEWYPVEQNVEAGDIVSLTSQSFEYDAQGADPFTTLTRELGKQKVNVATKATKNAKLFGIISTGPYQTFGEDVKNAIEKGTNTSIKPLPLALNGRVPVKVTTENGPIQAGDDLTASSIPGVAAKAITAGPTIGKALEAFNQDGIGTVMVLAGNSWQDPDVYITSTGDWSLASQGDALQATSSAEPKPFVLKNPAGEVINRVGAFAELAVANIKAGFIQAESISTKTLAINGQPIKDYILAVVQEGLTQKTLISPISQTEIVRTNVISPLSSDSVVVNGKLVLRDSSHQGSNNSYSSSEAESDSAKSRSLLEVQNASGSAVAAIDASGNASFSGTLAAKDASISGTLRADKIIANTIEGLEAKIAKLRGLDATSSASFSENVLLSSAVDISSYSAQLAYIDNLQAATALFTDGFTSLAPAAFTQISVSDQLAISGNLVLADASINVLGTDLEIQPLKQGGISFLSGLVYIDIDGNLTVGGDATFEKDVTVKGKLAANFISPIPGSDLIIQLSSSHQGSNNTYPSSEAESDSAKSRSPNFIIQDSSGSAKFSINQLGDIIASGSATVGKINFNLIQPALAVSSTEVIATGSAGTAIVKGNKPELTINNTLVTEKSLIYITPVGTPSGQVPYLSRQISGKSFTIGLPQTSTLDTYFNWLIVN